MQSKSVDGDEPMTQIEDVPAQLRADRERKNEKIKAPLERRAKALHDDLAEGSAPIGDPVSSSPVGMVNKDRVSVRKIIQLNTCTPCRSPRVAAASSPGVGRTRQSSRASPSVVKLGGSKQVKKPVEKGNKVA